MGVPFKGVEIPSQIERVLIQDMGVSFQGFGVFFQGVVVPYWVYLKNFIYFFSGNRVTKIVQITQCFVHNVCIESKILPNCGNDQLTLL